MRRSDRSLRILIVFASAVLGGVGCGGVTAQSDAGQTTGKGGSGTAGAAGRTGAAGDQGTGGTGGSAGSGSGGVGGSGQAGTVGAGGSGASGSGGPAGMGGVGGSGQGGHAGGIAGTGGNTDGGAKDAIDAPVNACGFLPTIDRSCTVDADCLAFTHTFNCCGSAIWVGIRASEKDRFIALETACDRTYPACGCASGPPLTDDGSIVRYGSTAGVSCQGGACKTFSKACGHPCGTGRTCTTCMAPDAGATSFCSLQCTGDTMCTEPNLMQCLLGSGVCVNPNIACGVF